MECNCCSSRLDLRSDAVKDIVTYTCIESSAKLGNLLNTIKHCVVTKIFSGWTPLLIMFDRILSHIKHLIKYCKKKTFCSFRHA